MARGAGCFYSRKVIPMKSDRSVKRVLRALRTICETSKDPTEARIAQAMEKAIRWSREETRGWLSMDREAIVMAGILRDDLRHETHRTRPR